MFRVRTDACHDRDPAWPPRRKEVQVEHSRVEKLGRDEGVLVVLGCEESTVVSPSPFGRPVPEWGMKTECRVALHPVLDNIPPQLPLQTTAPIRIVHRDIGYEESRCWEGV